MVGTIIFISNPRKNNSLSSFDFSQTYAISFHVQEMCMAITAAPDPLSFLDAI